MDEPTPVFDLATPTLPFDPNAAPTPELHALVGVGNDMAGAIVQGYGIVNAYNFFDYFWMFIILAGVIFSIWSLNKRLQRET